MIANKKKNKQEMQEDKKIAYISGDCSGLFLQFTYEPMIMYFLFYF